MATASVSGGPLLVIISCLLIGLCPLGIWIPGLAANLPGVCARDNESHLDGRDKGTLIEFPLLSARKTQRWGWERVEGVQLVPACQLCLPSVAFISLYSLFIYFVWSLGVFFDGVFFFRLLLRLLLVFAHLNPNAVFRNVLACFVYFIIFCCVCVGYFRPSFVGYH